MYIVHGSAFWEKMDTQRKITYNTTERIQTKIGFSKNICTKTVMGASDGHILNPSPCWL